MKQSLLSSLPDLRHLRWLVVVMLWLHPFNLAGQQVADDASGLLTGYLMQAARNNPGLQADYQQYLAALQQVPQVSALPDPEVSFGYFINPIETRVGPQQARFGLTQMFPWFGTLGTRGDAAAQKARAAFETFRESRNQLFYQVHERWYHLYEIEQSIGIMQEHIGILDTYESIATSRYETGQVGQADILLVQIEKEDIRTKLALMRDNRAVAARQLRELLDLPADASVLAADTLRAARPVLPLAEIEAAVAQQNPQLGRIGHQLQAAEHEVEAAHKEGLPDFGLGFDYIFTGRRSMTVAGNGQDALMVRAGIQLPLYRKKYRANEKQAQLQLQAVRHREEAVLNQLQTRLAEAWRNYEDARRRVQLYEELQLQRTRQAIRVLTEEYANGETDFEELLRLQRKLLNYQLQREEAVVANNTAVARIEYLYGKHNVNPQDLNHQSQ